MINRRYRRYMLSLWLLLLLIFVCGEVPAISGELDEFLLTKKMAEEMLLELEGRPQGEKKPMRTVALAQCGYSLPDIHRIVDQKARKFGIKPNFIRAMVKCESDYNIRAVSRKGAKGLMQLMPDTAREMGVRDIWSPPENIEGGVKYIFLLLKEFNGDVQKSLIAYNCGPNRIRKKMFIPPESVIYAKRVIGTFKRLNAENEGR